MKRTVLCAAMLLFVTFGARADNSTLDLHWKADLPITANGNYTSKPTKFEGGSGEFLVQGTFDSATVTLQYSVDNTNWLTMDDTSGTAIAKAAAADKVQFFAGKVWIRINVAGGGASLNLTQVGITYIGRTASVGLSMLGIAGTAVCSTAPTAGDLLTYETAAGACWASYTTGDIGFGGIVTADSAVHTTDVCVEAVDSGTCAPPAGQLTTDAICVGDPTCDTGTDLLRVVGSSGNVEIDSSGGLKPGFLTSSMNVNNQTLSNIGGINFHRNSVGFTYNAKTADLATVTFLFPGQDAYASAVTNLDGGSIDIDAGDGASGSAGDADGGAVTIDGGIAYGTGDDGNVVLAGTRGDVVINGCTHFGALSTAPSGAACDVYFDTDVNKLCVHNGTGFRESDDYTTACS